MLARMQKRGSRPAAGLDLGHEIAPGEQVVPKARRCGSRHSKRGRDYCDFAHDFPLASLVDSINTNLEFEAGGRCISGLIPSRSSFLACQRRIDGIFDWIVDAHDTRHSLYDAIIRDQTV